MGRVDEEVVVEVVWREGESRDCWWEGFEKERGGTGREGSGFNEEEKTGWRGMEEVERIENPLTSSASSASSSSSAWDTARRGEHTWFSGPCCCCCSCWTGIGAVMDRWEVGRMAPPPLLMEGKGDGAEEDGKGMEGWASEASMESPLLRPTVELGPLRWALGEVDVRGEEVVMERVVEGEVVAMDAERRVRGLDADGLKLNSSVSRMLEGEKHLAWAAGDIERGGSGGMDEQVRRSLAESDAIGRVDAHSVDRLLGDLGDTSEVVFSLKAQEHISRQESERVGGGRGKTHTVRRWSASFGVIRRK
jgi:hypothetical protein